MHPGPGFVPGRSGAAPAGQREPLGHGAGRDRTAARNDGCGAAPAGDPGSEDLWGGGEPAGTGPRTRRSCGTAATKFTAGRTRAAHTPLGYGPVVKAALEDQWQRRCTDRRGARLRAPAARHATRSLEADEQLPVRRDRASGIEDPIQPLRMQGFRSSPGWTRTNNPPVNSRMLCQLSYRGPTAKRRSQSSRCPELL